MAAKSVVSQSAKRMDDGRLLVSLPETEDYRAENRAYLEEIIPLVKAKAAENDPKAIAILDLLGLSESSMEESRESDEITKALNSATGSLKKQLSTIEEIFLSKPFINSSA